MSAVLRNAAPVVFAAALLAPAAARADAMVAGSHRTEMLDCGGGDAVVNGDANRLVFHGECRSLRLNGADNVVEIDLVPSGSVGIDGAGNRVFYTPIVPGPVVSTRGAGNEVTAGTPGEASAALAPAVPAAPPSPAVIPPAETAAGGTLVLSGDAQDQVVGCTGRNVLIEGSNGRFILRGGCRSVTVQGRADTIEAELQPGARVAIGGDAVTLHYTLTAAGPPPVVSVTGSGSTATQAPGTGGAVILTEPGLSTRIERVPH